MKTNNNYERGYCWICHRRTSHKDDEGKFVCVTCAMKSLDTQIDDREKEIISQLKHSKLSVEEITTLLQSKPQCIKNNGIKHNYKKTHIKLGIMSDMHIGSKFFNEDGFNYCKKTFDSQKVDAIYCPGDIIEGMSGRDGQVYELSDLGYTEQLEHAYKLLNSLNQKFYFITGNHDAWARNKGNAGLIVGKEIEKNVEKAEFLGEMEADIMLNDKIKLRLSHRGSSAYALSYSGQKMINGLEGGTKPQIIINGHVHKSLYMQYRNIHYLEAGTLQNQSEFMAMKGSPAMVGFWILDIKYDKEKIVSFKPEWNPIYTKL